MAKKRKSSARDAGDKGPNMDVGESRKRIRTYEDVADSDDEFHLNRDRILLEEQPDAKRRRKQNEEEAFLEQSDEEVLDHSGSEDEDNEQDEAVGEQYAQDTASEQSGSGDEGEEEGWGTTKADLYGADEIETEEQALEEEAEARRLQKKQLQAMSAADYGFDKSEWQDADNGQAADGADKTVVTEVLPQLQIAEDMAPAERLKLLKSRYPEFEPLSKELLQLQERHRTLVHLLQEAKDKGLVSQMPNMITSYRAASAYLGALTMYFALLTSTASTGTEKSTAMSATQLRGHPMMDSLVKCRDLWQNVQDLPADEVSSENVGSAGEDEASVANMKRAIAGAEKASAETALASNSKKQKKSRVQRHANAVQAAADARKADRIRRTEADLADLDALVAPSATSKRRTKAHPDMTAQDDDSDMGEEAPLTAQEAAEKAQKKKSLRFYTSQIAQKANKRGAAGRGTGGDEDVPYRERLKDRQARLNAEAEKRGRFAKKADIGDDLGGSSDEEDHARAREIRAEVVEGDDGYYDLVASKTARKKSEKAALAEAQKQAALQGGEVIEQETVGADGKRKITYAIEKNKGLTPHRKKDVRNPRVKKRRKFDEKKKKLASIKPVYKGGEGRGGYGGELTGIKKGLVKSTKL